MDFLPEDCISHILSFATPRDACRMCLVSSIVQSSVDSDSVWFKFLPSDYHHIVSSALDFPLKFSSMKDLFFKLCVPIRVDNGKKIFWIDKRTAKKCYILSARELSVTLTNQSTLLLMDTLSFLQVAELKTNFWLEIQGTITAPALSPNSTYELFLIARFANRAFGLGIVQSIDVGTHHSQCSDNCCKQPSLQYICYSKSTKVLIRTSCCGERDECARVRDDGWIEIKLDGFHNYGIDQNGYDDVLSNLMDVKDVFLNGELLVEGVELRVKRMIKYEINIQI